MIITHKTLYADFNTYLYSYFPSKCNSFKMPIVILCNEPTLICVFCDKFIQGQIIGIINNRNKEKDNKK